MTKIKICGLKRPEDIEIINRLSPDFAGFIIGFPKSHRSISPEQVRILTDKLDRDRISAVGVFVDSPAQQVAELLNSGCIDIAQLHGNEDEKYISALRTLTYGKIIKAFKIKAEADLAAALSCTADYILLDQGQGSGQSFDWSILEGCSELKGKKWFLAGGLNAYNILEAISAYHPYAADLSSSVETDGFKDPKKIEQVIHLVREANQI